MPKTPSTADRRRFTRVIPKPEQPVRVNINGEDFIDIFNAEDISLDGVGIRVPHGFKGCEINRQVLFIIDLPLDGKRLCAQVPGRILHISGPCFGVAFAEMSETNRSKIRQYISQRLKEDSLLDWLKFEINQWLTP